MKIVRRRGNFCSTAWSWVKITYGVRDDSLLRWVDNKHVYFKDINIYDYTRYSPHIRFYEVVQE